MEIDGRQMVAWLAKASEPERQALIGATYSDSDSEWRIEELQPSKLLAREYPFDTSSRVTARPLPLFADGAFVFEGVVGEHVMESVQAAMTTHECRIETAKSYLLSALGFPLVDLGGDPAILSAFDALLRMERLVVFTGIHRREVPTM